MGKAIGMGLRKVRFPDFSLSAQATQKIAELIKAKPQDIQSAINDVVGLLSKLCVKGRTLGYPNKQVFEDIKNVCDNIKKLLPKNKVALSLIQQFEDKVEKILIAPSSTKAIVSKSGIKKAKGVICQ